jgi:predicted aspartyl protease
MVIQLWAEHDADGSRLFLSRRLTTKADLRFAGPSAARATGTSRRFGCFSGANDRLGKLTAWQWRPFSVSEGGAAMRYQRTALITCLTIWLLPVSAWASEIPLGQSGGIYTVPAQINRSMTVQFLVDPGSAVVVIPRSILNQLIRDGTVTQDDIVGVGVAELADRSLYEAVHLRLRELKVGDIVAHDVIAAVAPALSQPLLGQTFLGRFASVTFDNQRHVLILSPSSVAAVSRYPTTPAPAYPQGLPTQPGAYGQPSYRQPVR